MGWRCRVCTGRVNAVMVLLVTVEAVAGVMGGWSV